MAKLIIPFLISILIFGCGSIDTDSDPIYMASNHKFMSVKEKCLVNPNCFWR